MLYDWDDNYVDSFDQYEIWKKKLYGNLIIDDGKIIYFCNMGTYERITPKEFANVLCEPLRNRILKGDILSEIFQSTPV